MMRVKTSIILFLVIAGWSMASTSFAQQKSVSSADLKKLFQSPPPSASPWVFWYWMNGNVSAEGITADLEAMKQVGIGGAYLMPIKDTVIPSLYTPAVRQLTPEWWKMVKHALKEADRLGLQIAMHVSDGFALAGGPWITPEMSMQKVVWTKQEVNGGQAFNAVLPLPEMNEGYYKDIAVFAYPSQPGTGVSSTLLQPKVTTSKPNAEEVQSLVDPDNKKSFTCDDGCWIQYEFAQPFTCRAIVIKSKNNYQSNRLIIQVSSDGIHFDSLTRLDPPRHGWQDWDSDYTHVIPATTSKYFRFVYDKNGTEPGAEDLDAAKWKPSFKVTGIELLSEPHINQYEGKNGEVWRISKRTTQQEIPDSICIPKNKLIDLTSKLDKYGNLNWNVPAGNWTIIRMGHTSTGHKNETAGGGKGLECDKFNSAAVKLQFDSWYGEALKQAGPVLAKNVLTTFHIDSWECGSQNWSETFAAEFKKRRGYDLLPYLPVMAGIPIESAETSEKILYDVRKTIAELINDVFYATLRDLAHAKGKTFTAESVAPTMVSDGMLHYQNVDVPMGEFWLRSPTHDKPNDMLDAISGAHVYGKNIVQAEGFTELRMYWDEHPGMLKPIADRNFALGINRLVFHVFAHNPWLHKKPGITLDDIGLYFQRDQIWWKQGRAWVDYVKRCQTLLQVGKPVVDIAVFTGEEMPRRAVLPDRLIPLMPGIFGEEKVQQEAKRLANIGQPQRQLPVGVTHSANMADPEDFIDPLNGYKYDSFNEDALLRLAKMKNKKIELPGGASYGLLVLPGTRKMVPNGELMSVDVGLTIRDLVEKGGRVLIENPSNGTPGLDDYDRDFVVNASNDLYFSESGYGTYPGPIITKRKFGAGEIIKGPYRPTSFNNIGIPKDFIATQNGEQAKDIAWTHRAAPGLDIYFVSNQQMVERTIDVSLRVKGKRPELWDAETSNVAFAKEWKIENSRTKLPIKLPAGGSVFIVLKETTQKQSENLGKNWEETKVIQTIDNSWTVTFDTAYAGPAQPVVFDKLTDWSKHDNPAIRYYSGPAIYKTAFNFSNTTGNNAIYLDLGKVANIATVKLNGIPCGTAWTTPYKVDITKAIRQGNNMLEIEVSNTWANRLIGDLALPESQRSTFTTAPLRPLKSGRANMLLEAGLLGPVVIGENK